MQDKVLELLNAVLSDRLVYAIELCNELEDELVIRHQKQLRCQEGMDNGEF